LVKIQLEKKKGTRGGGEVMCRGEKKRRVLGEKQSKFLRRAWKQARGKGDKFRG